MTGAIVAIDSISEQHDTTMEIAVGFLAVDLATFSRGWVKDHYVVWRSRKIALPPSACRLSGKVVMGDGVPE